MTMGREYEQRAVERFSADLLRALDGLLVSADDQVLQYEVKSSRTRVVVCTVERFREVVKDVQAKFLGIEDGELKT